MAVVSSAAVARPAPAAPAAPAVPAQRFSVGPWVPSTQRARAQTRAGIAASLKPAPGSARGTPKPVSTGTAGRPPKATKRPTSSAVSKPSPLNAAIARIPNYSPGMVRRWTYSDRYGHYGVTNLGTREITISPRVPPRLMYSVVVHEYSHALVVSGYRGDWAAADADLSRYFGSPAGRAREQAADCMALLQGATWTNYTSCTDANWRQAARTLLAGHRL